MKNALERVFAALPERVNTDPVLQREGRYLTTELIGAPVGASEPRELANSAPKLTDASELGRGVRELRCARLLLLELGLARMQGA